MSARLHSCFSASLSYFNSSMRYSYTSLLSHPTSSRTSSHSSMYLASVFSPLVFYTIAQKNNNTHISIWPQGRNLRGWGCVFVQVRRPWGREVLQPTHTTTVTRTPCWESDQVLAGWLCVVVGTAVPSSIRLSQTPCKSVSLDHVAPVKTATLISCWSIKVSPASRCSLIQSINQSINQWFKVYFVLQANLAFHPCGVGKWVPASDGKAKACMVHSVSGWTRGMQVKQWDPLRTCVIPERLRGAFTTRRYTNPRLPLLLPFQHECWIVQWKLNR